MGYDVGRGRNFSPFRPNKQFQIQGTRSSKFLWNIGKFLPEYTALQYTK